MLRTIRVLIVILFWVIQLWWIGHIVQAIRFAPGGSFRVYSVMNNDVTHVAWGLTFEGAKGLALAIVYLILVICALIGLTMMQRTMWILAALIVFAWGMLFAGNSMWMARWSGLAWWDWVNFAGVVIVIAQIALTSRRALRIRNP